MDSPAQDLGVLQAACHGDLYLFAKFLLGYNDLEIEPHKKMCDFLTANPDRNKLLLVPRGSFKTSIATIAYPIWRLAHNPDLRILIGNERLDNAVVFLSGIKSILEQNKLFRSIYGDWTTENWTKEDITISKRTRWDVREPSVSTMGMGVVKVGMHTDLNILDDMHSEKNTTTAAQIDKVIESYKLMSAILEPTGQTVVVGTRWSYMDLYEWIMSHEQANFDVMVESAEREDGSLFFPSRLTKKYLDTQKARLGSMTFAMQYQNQVVNDETATFKRSWLGGCYYELGQNPKFHDAILIIDPAISAEKGADFSAFIVLQMDGNGDIWVIEANRHKLEAHQIVEKIFDYIGKHRIGKIAIETNVFQKFLKFALKQEMGKRKVFIPVMEVKASTKSTKEYRISGLAAGFEAGQIKIRKDMTDLIDEYLRYPKSPHDDLLDALAYAPVVLKPQGNSSARQEKSQARFYDDKEKTVGY